MSSTTEYENRSSTITIGEAIEQARREVHASKIEQLTEGGYFDDCYFAPGVTPQNLTSIVGYNLVTRDRIEDLIREKIAEKHERNYR